MKPDPQAERKPPPIDGRFAAAIVENDGDL